MTRPLASLTHLSPEDLTSTMRTYKAWESMKQRCLNKKALKYYIYGARGITICSRWMQFEYFLKDMGKCAEGFSLDRINTNGNYEPSNCKWSTAKEQADNRRNTQKIKCYGIEKPEKDWCSLLGRSSGYVRYSLSVGKRIEDIIPLSILDYSI